MLFFIRFYRLFMIVLLSILVVACDKNRSEIKNEGHSKILKSIASGTYSSIDCKTPECLQYNKLVLDYKNTSNSKLKSEFSNLASSLPEEQVINEKETIPGFFIFILFFIMFLMFVFMSKVSSSSEKRLKAEKESERLTGYVREKEIEFYQNKISLEQKTSRLLDESRQREQQTLLEKKEVLDKYSPIINLEKAVQDLSETKSFLFRETSTLKQIKDELDLFQVGFYSFRYDFNESKQYTEAMDLLKLKEKKILKEDGALVWNNGKRFHGLSEKEALRLTKNIEKLAMMAFSGEIDSLLTKVKYNNVDSCIDKVSSIAKSIEKLLEEYDIHFRVKFLNLKEEEISLVHEYQELLQKEREEQKLIREQMKEEEKALREAKRAEEEAEKEEKSYEKALEKARLEMQSQKEENQAQFLDKIKELENKLVAAQLEKQRAKSQAELTKQGHVYIISNIGSFGENIYKIGMTRRLEPMDRIWELGDASVPFDFDVHAMIHSENAPELENKLHRHFSERRVNKVNDKKEFFKVSLEEIATACKKLHEKEDLKIAMVAEAKEYKQSILKMDKTQNKHKG